MVDKANGPSPTPNLEMTAAALSAALATGEVLEDLLGSMLGSGELPQQLERRGMQPFKTTYAKWHGLWRARRAGSPSTSIPGYQVEKAIRAAEEFSLSLEPLDASVLVHPANEIVLVTPATAAVHPDWAQRLDDREPIGPIFNEVRGALAALAAARAHLRLALSRQGSESEHTDR